LAECVVAHLPRRHQELAALPLALAAHMAVHRDVVGWVRKGGGGLLAGQQGVVGGRCQCVPAEETVRTQPPQIALPRYGLTFHDLKFVRRRHRLFRRIERLNQKIDLWRFETRRLDLEVERCIRQLLQDDRQFAMIPARALRQLLSASIRALACCSVR
jgi:hypothetical protein